MRPSRPVPEGTTVFDIANASRVALNEFIELDAADTDALSRWLSGAYRDALSHASREIPHEAKELSSQPLTESDVRSAQRAANKAIAAAWNGSPEQLIRILPSLVDVIPVHDTSGARGFAPIDRPRSSLATRALTLLLADFLTRPADYTEAIESVA
jgi:hypothetical protein